MIHAIDSGQQLKFMDPVEQNQPGVEKPIDPPREELISTAVAFLKLPQVQSSPLKGKQEFLLSKGLTDEEVRISCEIAGVFGQSTKRHESESHIYNSFPPVRQEQSRLWWPVMRDVGYLTAIVIGIYFVSQAMYEKFLYKYFTDQKKGRKTVEQSQSEMLEQSQSEMLVSLQSNVTEKLMLVQTQLNELDSKLSKLVENLNSQDLENQLNNKQMDDLRSEVLSLKGLLLNRKQFPTPNSLVGGTPCIPAWQLKQESHSNGSGSHQDSKLASDHSEGSEPELISKDTGSNGSDSSLEIVSDSRSDMKLES